MMSKLSWKFPVWSSVDRLGAFDSILTPAVRVTIVLPVHRGRRLRPLMAGLVCGHLAMCRSAILVRATLVSRPRTAYQDDGDPPRVCYRGDAGRKLNQYEGASPMRMSISMYLPASRSRPCILSWPPASYAPRRRRKKLYQIQGARHSGRAFQRICQKRDPGLVSCLGRRRDVTPRRRPWSLEPQNASGSSKPTARSRHEPQGLPKVARPLRTRSRPRGPLRLLPDGFYALDPGAALGLLELPTSYYKGVAVTIQHGVRPPEDEYRNRDREGVPVTTSRNRQGGALTQPGTRYENGAATFST